MRASVRFAILIATVFVVGLTVCFPYLAERPRLFRLKDPSTADPSDGLVVVMNPLRRRAPEIKANDFLDQLRKGPCERVLNFIAEDRRADLCARERAYKIVNWKLRDREDKDNQVRLFYSVYRRQSLTVPTNVWITMVRTNNGWVTKDFECWY